VVACPAGRRLSLGVQRRPALRPRVAPGRQRLHPIFRARAGTWRGLSMPKVSWSAFMDRYPAAHLIAGVIPEDEALPANARRQLALMARLIAWLAPKGVCALTVDRQNRTPEIHCGSPACLSRSPSTWTSTPRRSTRCWSASASCAAAAPARAEQKELRPFDFLEALRRRRAKLRLQ
jgi:hypothetical protein